MSVCSRGGLKEAFTSYNTPFNYCFLPFQTNRKLHHPNNAQLGMAIMRAGVVHWHAGEIEEAHGLICKAYRILLATHGPNHAITKDLEVGLPRTVASTFQASKQSTVNEGKRNFQGA